MERVRFLIIGSGMTGLGFASFLRAPPEDWLLLERDTEPGGYCRTIKQDGFVWDYSGHFFHFRHPDLERYLTDRMAPGSVSTVTKVSGILYGGTRIDFPFQKNIHQLPREDFLECLHDLYFRDTDREVRSFKDLLFARLGRGIAEKFLIPYNEKLYACDLDRLDPEAMGRFFPHAEIADIIRNFRRPDNASYNATFTYPRGGAIEYVNALLDRLPRERIALGEALVSLDLDAHVATTSRGRQIGYEHVISSAPFPKLLELCGLGFDRSVYSWNKVLVFNLGFDRPSTFADHWLYVPDPSVVFYRVGFYDNIFHSDRMSLYIEIGLPWDAPPSDVPALQERVLSDLARLGIVTEHQLVASHHVLLDPAYVHITSESKVAHASRAEWLAGRGIHAVGRYGGWTYCAIEDNLVEARALANRLTPEA